ncbi:torsin-1A-interacting protein 2-like isoform X2 [Myxocyprinus asiaticus]|uniref:torsin-1A-interacting protein 2-like isoform X2 n=1 Tax=Myxocyprinus asiaticus TaxID=70543 RepID=UPI0022225EC8|nr:torsin-1A-interacting protein 2-like isoform X2 [Myxocyprinus asiaticus]
MESGDSEEDASHTRRSTRQSSKTVLFYADLKPRPPLKRTRKAREDDAASRAVNGSKEPKSPAKGDDDESPVKIQKLQEAEGGKESGDGFNHTDEADVEMDENVDQDEDMNSEEEAEQDHGLSVKPGPVIDEKHATNVWQVNPEIKLILRSRRSIHPKTVDPELYKPKTQANYSSKPPFKDLSSLAAVPVQLESLENQQEVLQKRIDIKYQDHKEEKARDALRVPLLRSSNRYPPPSEPHSIHGYQTNNLLIRKQPPYPKTQELKKPVIISKASPASTSRGRAWYIRKSLQWSLIVILLLALGLLGYQKFQDSLLPTTDEVQAATLEKFELELAALQLLFPSQCSVFWTRSRKHLKRHLQTLNPTEPVSLILTSGFKAERTLGCLARRLAAVYSTSLNSSIIEIDGTTKTAQDSDQVKLDIDTVLRVAFGGNKSAAVIHRFEELPPGSTLIFYRYCDHENAAYKNVSLVFTVMLSVDTIEPEASLSVVEDMIYEKIKGKFVLEKTAQFNQMDVDKLSGLWSRISHLILPVAAEEKFEQQGCEG